MVGPLRPVFRYHRQFRCLQFSRYDENLYLAEVAQFQFTLALQFEFTLPGERVENASRSMGIT